MARYRAISALENFDELPEDFDFFSPFLFVDLAFDFDFDFDLAFDFDFDFDLAFDDFLSFAVGRSFADTLAGFVSSAELSIGE